MLKIIESLRFTNKLLHQVLLSLFQALLQEAQISGRGGVLKAPREAESGSFVFWFHCSLVQEVVCIYMVDNGPVGQCYHHLHRKVVALQVQPGLFAQHRALFISLQILQFFD